MAKAITDHEEIRRWAERNGGKPAVVKSTHGDRGVGLIRLMFPENRQSGHDALEEISWDEFFRQFDDSNLALLCEENGLFNKIVGRDTVAKREHGDHSASRH